MRLIGKITLILLLLNIFATDKVHTGQPQQEPAGTIETWLEEGLRYWRQVESVPSLISFYADRQLGIDYVGGLLDEPDEEKLVVTLNGSDCVIYVEMTQALTITTLQQQTSYNAFRQNLKLLRYRQGEVDGYTSRLHYFSDWLLTNQEKGLLEILFQDEELPRVDAPDIMTEKRDQYRHIADDDRVYEKLRRIEEQLAARELRYIPEERIPEYEDRFETGDILAFVTSTDGLDITHTALVNMENNRAGFYHASMTGAVIEDPNTIHRYAGDRNNVKGIVIARLRSPQE